MTAPRRERAESSQERAARRIRGRQEQRALLEEVAARPPMRDSRCAWCGRAVKVEPHSPGCLYDRIRVWLQRHPVGGGST